MTGGISHKIKRTESALQAAICRYLDRALPSTSWYAAVPNGSVLAGGAEQRARQMARLKATGLKPGCPDLVLCWNGRFIGMEVKTDTGRLSDKQKDCSDAITLAGGLWTVVRSVEEVQSFLDMIGVPLRARVMI